MTDFKDIIKNYNNIILEATPPKSNISQQITEALKNIIDNTEFPKSNDEFIKNCIEVIPNNIIGLRQKNNNWQYIFKEAPKAAQTSSEQSSSEQSETGNEISSSSSDATGSSQADTNTQPKTEVKPNSQLKKKPITPETDEGEDRDQSIFAENTISDFLKIYNLIMQQAAEQKKSDSAIPNSKPKTDASTDQAAKKAADSEKSKIQQQMQDDVENNITLQVFGVDNFQFFDNESGQPIQSEQSIRKLDNYVRQHLADIVKQRIARQTDVSNKKTAGYNKAVEFIIKNASLANIDKVDKDNLLKAIKNVSQQLYDKCSKGFSFEAENRENITAGYAILVGIAIIICANKPFKKKQVSKNNQQNNTNAITTTQLSTVANFDYNTLKNHLIEIMRSKGLDPTKKEDLQKVLANSNKWNQGNRQIYIKIINQLLLTAK